MCRTARVAGPQTADWKHPFSISIFECVFCVGIDSIETEISKEVVASDSIRSRERCFNWIWNIYGKVEISHRLSVK